MKAHRPEAYANNLTQRRRRRAAPKPARASKQRPPGVGTATTLKTKGSREAPTTPPEALRRVEPAAPRLPLMSRSYWTLREGLAQIGKLGPVEEVKTPKNWLLTDSRS